uniref:Putative DNA binding, helix-turn-helix domain containing protein n=1 Tax=viral metagenome TaxID=1070528 RepID=A0A6M3IWF5_9ZZZZ
MMSVETAAKKWRISSQRVRQWLAAGRIKGAVKVGRDWVIPQLAKRPKKKLNGAKA